MLCLGVITSNAQAAGRPQGERVTVVLAPRDPAGLAAYATAVSQPGSPLFRHYLSVAAFVRRFAPASHEVRRLEESLRREGWSIGPLSVNHLSMIAAIPGLWTRRASRVGSRQLGRSRSRGGARVQAVILPGRAPVPRPGGSLSPGQLGPSCGVADALAAAGGGLTRAAVGAAYGLLPLWANGDIGSRVTIGVYELEPFSPADIAAYQACSGTRAAISSVPVDGGAGVGPGSGEAAMDIEALVGLAPGATIKVYSAPADGLGAYDAYARMIGDDAAQIITTSWGVCEPERDRALLQAEATLFQEAAVQGQTVLAASGDQGPDDCGTGVPAVDDPASQPWVTAVGATSRHNGVDVAWSDALGASGGGASQAWPAPAYQRRTAAGVLGSACRRRRGGCRAVPDLSLDGDPSTGYPIVWNGAWHLVGGTSVSTPTLASILALTEATPSCGGRRVGFINPSLYSVIAHQPGALVDVTTGTSSYDGLGFPAGPGYDLATGLGAPGPDFAAALCAPGLAPVGHGAVTHAGEGSLGRSPGH